MSSSLFTLPLGGGDDKKGKEQPPSGSKLCDPRTWPPRRRLIALLLLIVLVVAVFAGVTAGIANSKQKKPPPRKPTTTSSTAAAAQTSPRTSTTRPAATTTSTLPRPSPTPTTAALPPTSAKPVDTSVYADGLSIDTRIRAAVAKLYMPRIATCYFSASLRGHNAILDPATGSNRIYWGPEIATFDEGIKMCYDKCERLPGCTSFDVNGGDKSNRRYCMFSTDGGKFSEVGGDTRCAVFFTSRGAQMLGAPKNQVPAPGAKCIAYCDHNKCDT